MQGGTREYQYAVVYFLNDRPCEDIGEFVCVPHSWIQIRKATLEYSLVRYPNERSSVTQRRIKDGEQPSDKWTLYIAVVKRETYTYEDAKMYILEKKYGVADEDLAEAGTGGVNAIEHLQKILQKLVSPLEVTMSKLKVVQGTNGSAKKKRTAKNTSNLPTKNQKFVYPYLQQIPDFFKYIAPDNDCEEMGGSNIISREVLNSMKQHILESFKEDEDINTDHNIDISEGPEVDIENPQVVPTEKVSEKSSAAEPSQLIDGKRSQDSNIQPMIVDQPEVSEEVSLEQDDDSDQSWSPGEEVDAEKTDQPIDYPIDKIRKQADFLTNMFEKMKNSQINSSERILEVHKSFELSIELVKRMRNAYSAKKLELNKGKQDEVETADAEMRNDDVRNSSNDEDGDKKAPKKPRDLRKFVLPPEYDSKDTRWTLKYREYDSELGLVELVPGSKVFINAVRLAHCKRVSKDCKALARMLLAEIFSQSALAVCSLTGAKANAFHNNGTYVRPGLDAHARATILAYVEDYTREKQWAAYDKQSVMNSIRSKVQDIRSKLART